MMNRKTNAGGGGASLKSSTDIAAEIAAAQTTKLDAESRVDELNAAYRSTLLNGSDAEADAIARDLASAQRQVERATLLIEDLERRNGEAQARESAEAKRAHIAGLEARREALEARLGSMIEGLDSVYARAAREIAAFLREWDQAKGEALELDRDLADAGLERGARSREIVGWKAPDVWMEERTTESIEWVVPDGQGGWRRPTMWVEGADGKLVPQDPRAVLRKVKATTPARMAYGAVHSPLFDDSNLKLVNLPAPRRGESPFWTSIKEHP